MLRWIHDVDGGRRDTNRMRTIFKPSRWTQHGFAIARDRTSRRPI